MVAGSVTGKVVADQRPQRLRSHTVARGGTTIVAYAGWPDQSPATAVTEPRLPTPGAGVRLGVGVEDLLPLAVGRQAEPVVVVRHRGEVGDADHVGRVAGAATDEGEDVAAGVVGVDPLEAAGVVVARPDGGGADVRRVEVAHQVVDAAVLGVLEQPPVELARLGPLRLLAELAAHEEQLLAGVRPHEGEVGAQVGELLPPVARHLAQQRALAVHDLVVGERQHVVLGERVDERERHLAVVVGAVHRLVGQVAERVVHPAHVPLEAEAQAVGRRRPGDAGPRRRLLGDRDDAGDALVDGGVHLLEELHGLEVLAAAVDVGRPLAVLAGVVEVEHRGDAVDAQPVGVELLEPVDARWRRGSCAPRGGRSRRCGSPTPCATRAAGWGPRRAACRRSGPAPTRRWRSGRAPSRGSRRCRPGAAGRRAAGSRRGRRSASPARSTTSRGSPTSRRTGAASPASARRG